MRLTTGHLIATVVGIALGFFASQMLRGTGADEKPIDTHQVAKTTKPSRAEIEKQEINDSDVLEASKPVADEATYRAFLEERNYSRDALVGVALLSRELSFLMEAAQRYPDDPQVQLMVIESREFPGDKTEWFRRFKKSQPDNLLASLLLGSHLLENGDTVAALAELRVGGGQSDYNDFNSAAALSMESTLIGLGEDAYGAKVRSANASPLSATLRIQKGIIDLNHVIESSTDSARKTELATLGAAIGNQLSEGEANRSFVNQLFGLSMEKNFLKQLDPDTQLPEFSQSPAELIEQIDAERASLNEDIEFTAEHAGDLEPRQMMHFLDRQRSAGDRSATDWLRAQIEADE